MIVSTSTPITLSAPVTVNYIAIDTRKTKWTILLKLYTILHMSVVFSFENSPESKKLNPCVRRIVNVTRHQPNRSFKHVFPMWSIEYNAKYAGYQLIGKDQKHRFEREPGSIHIMAPGIIFREEAKQADLPMLDLYMAFDWAEPCPLRKLLKPGLKFGKIHEPEGLVGEQLKEAAESCTTSGQDSIWRVQTILMQIVEHLLQSRLNSKGEWILTEFDLPEQRAFSEEVDIYLQKHITKQIKVPDIAAHLNVSESFLYHQFRSETGQSPAARFTELKVNAIKGMLLKGSRLKEIASIMNYSSEFYLSRMFKKETGMTPRDFRMQASVE